MWTVGSNHRKEASSETRTRLGIWRRRVAAALAIAMLFGGMANLPARAQITIGTIGDQTGAGTMPHNPLRTGARMAEQLWANRLYGGG